MLPPVIKCSPSGQEVYKLLSYTQVLLFWRVECCSNEPKDSSDFDKVEMFIAKNTLTGNFQN